MTGVDEPEMLHNPVSEFYIPDAPTDDLRYYAPMTETIWTRPIFISTSQNRWCNILMSTGPAEMNRHYHPQQVLGYTISGRWGYLERGWTASAGDFAWEAPGEAHSLVMYEASKVYFDVTGPLIWLDDNGEVGGVFDVFDYVKLVKEHYDTVGIGGDYIDRLIR